MNSSASLGAFFVVAMSIGGAAQAFTLAEAATPAETPPSSYAQDVYVDSRGCVYVRASIGTAVNWVPRLSRDRETVVCGLTPSAAVAVAGGGTTPGGATSGGATLPAAPALAAPPALATTATAAAPRIEPPAPAPVRSAAVPAPVAAAPVVEGPVTRTLDVTCPTDGSSARVRIGGDTVAVSCRRGMTRPTAYVVTHSDGSQSRLVAHPASGVADAPDTVVVGAASTVVDPTGVAAAPARPIRIPEGYEQAWDDDRLNPDRGPRTATGDAQMATVLDTSKVPMPAAEAAPVRPVVATARPAVVAPPVVAAPVVAKPPARVAPRASTAVAPNARFVQVGAFGVSSNATRAIANLHGLGFGAATARTRSGLTIVLAGPFANRDDLKRALRTLRGYYPDAYARS